MTLKQIFNHTSESITTAAVVLGAASLLSRVLGLLRDRLLTHQFGASDTLDAYYAAFRVPDFLYNLLILGALSTAFIPIFSEYITRDSRQRAWQFMNTSISTLGTIFFIISGVCALAAPVLIIFIAPGFMGEKQQLTIHLTQIMMLSPVLMGLSAIVGGALQSLRKFLLYALAPIMYNIGIIFGIVVFVPMFGIQGLAYGVVLGALLHLCVQIPALLQSGFRPQWIWNWRAPDVRLMLALMGPRALALAAVQINALIITALASKLPIGSVAEFTLANNIQSLPIGIIAVSYAVAAFPLMTQFAAEENPDGLARTIASTMRMVLTCIIPVMVLFLVLRTQWVRIIFGSGKFDWSATVATADALGFFAIGLVGQSLVHVLARGFYALKNTRVPAFTAIGSTVVGVVCAIFLMGRMGIAGLALASAIEATLNTIILWVLLRQRLGELEDGAMLRNFYKLIAAALVMGLIVQGLKNPIAYFVNMQTFVGVFLQSLGASLGGLIGFVTVGLLLRIDELTTIVNGVRARLKKLGGMIPIGVSDIDVVH